MFCLKCGKQIEDGAGFCPFCGAVQNTQQADQQQYTQQSGGQQNQQYQQAGQQSGGGNDTGSLLWVIPGALIPLAGFIIFFAIRKEKPKSAKMALIGACVGFIGYLILL